MAKLENSEKQPEPIKKNRTWEKIKTVGKTAGTFLVGAVVVIGIGAIIVTSGFSALYLGGGFPSRSGNWGSSSSSKRTYNSHVNQPEKAKNTPVRGVGSELWHKIKTNPWKTLGTALLATVFPAGTIIAGAITAGVVGKSAYDSHVNQPKKAKNTPVRGVGSELWHKIKTNPWKTLGTALLATAFPAGTIIAGAITAGVVGKSAYDSHVNQQAYKPQTVPPHALHSPTFVHKPSTTLSPSLTPKVTKVTHKGKHEGTRAR
jgi:hypothetical protein